MKIRNGSKSLSFTIEEYQYPSEKSHGDDYNYDANWLNVVIEYSDETGIKHYRDACLLTYELENCTEKIHKIISGEEMLYFSDFMEPYLKLAVSRAGDRIVFGIEFVYDTADGIWKSHKVSEVVSQARAQEMLDEMKSLSSRFPER